MTSHQPDANRQVKQQANCYYQH